MSFVRLLSLLLVASAFFQCKSRNSSEIKAPALPIKREVLSLEDISGDFLISDRSLVKQDRDGRNQLAFAMSFARDVSHPESMVGQFETQDPVPKASGSFVTITSVESPKVLNEKGEYVGFVTSSNDVFLEKPISSVPPTKEIDIGDQNGWKMKIVQGFFTTSKSLTVNATFVLKKADVSVSGTFQTKYEFSKSFTEMIYSENYSLSDEYVKAYVEAFPNQKEEILEYRSRSLSAKYIKVGELPEDLKSK